jgi:hypothetical protein
MSRSPIPPNPTMQAVLPKSALFTSHFSGRLCAPPCVKASSSFSRREAASIRSTATSATDSPLPVFVVGAEPTQTPNFVAASTSTPS